MSIGSMVKYLNISLLSVLSLSTFYLWSLLDRRFLEKYHLTWKLSDWHIIETPLLITTLGLSACIAWFLIEFAFSQNAISLKFDAISGSLLAGGLSIIALSLALILFNREYLAEQVSELGHIALAQEGFILCALVMFIITLLRGNFDGTGRIAFLRFRHIIAMIVCAIFLLFMEEISWGQHLFSWTTPEVFDGNIQDETNFHNFYTNRFEFIYYSAAFVAFSIMPLMLAPKSTGIFSQIQFYVPPVSFGIAALPVAALMYENWGILIFQIYFLVATFIAFFALQYSRGIHRLGCMVLMTLLAITQPIMLFNGHLLLLSFEMSEMRELTIAFALFMYSVWLYKKARRPNLERAI